MKKIRFFIRNHFGFSKRETNGFVLLAGLMVLALFLPSLFRLVRGQEEYTTSLHDQRLLDSLVATLPVKQARTYAVPSEENDRPDIDPNNASEDELEAVFGPVVSSNIVKYRQKGGAFRTKQDLKRIYGMEERLYLAASPHLTLPDTFRTPRSHHAPVANTLRLDINLADSTDLEKLRGIGPVFARRIVRYRELLGGFVSEEQLAEVYGLPPEALAALQESAFIAPDYLPRKIKLNSTLYDELRSHPYIGKKRASLILSYRSQHRAFSSVEELFELKGLTREEVRRILPYVEVNSQF